MVLDSDKTRFGLILKMGKKQTFKQLQVAWKGHKKKTFILQIKVCEAT